jgi:hypothetical protein
MLSRGQYLNRQSVHGYAGQGSSKIDVVTSNHHFKRKIWQLAIPETEEHQNNGPRD